VTDRDTAGARGGATPESADVSGPDSAAAHTDGRVARRERNIDAVLDVVLEMFAEESLFPTMEQAAKRSGLSLRSLYRYFADPSELLEATIRRNRERTAPLAHLHAIGQGLLDARIDDFVAMRLRVYEAVGPVYRATLAHAHRLPRISDERATTRRALRQQFELQFAPELESGVPADSEAALAAGDLLTQLDSIDYLRRHSGLSAAQTNAVLTATLQSLLA
jgi:AcrR family transcriptional regulator